MAKNQAQSAPVAPAPKVVTIYDVANHLGVSPTTVGRAINNRGRISEETRKEILSAAQKLGYRPSMVAQTLTRKQTCTLGVVVPMIGDTVYSPMVRAIEQTAFEKGYNIILCDTDIKVDRERAYMDMLIRRRVEGVVVIPFGERPAKGCEQLCELERLGIPVVVMEQNMPESRLTRIVADNEGDAKKLTQHLIRLGHERIAFFHFGLPSWDYAGNERLTGYRKALAEAGLPTDDSWVFQVGETIVDEEKSFWSSGVMRFLESGDRPTAIFAGSDMLAIRIMGTLYDRGVRVPEDVAVVGFDDILMAEHVRPRLTTVRQPAGDVGRRAAEVLFDRIAHKSTSWPVYERIPGTVIIRESCGNR